MGKQSLSEAGLRRPRTESTSGKFPELSRGPFGRETVPRNAIKYRPHLETLMQRFVHVMSNKSGSRMPSENDFPAGWRWLGRIVILLVTTRNRWRESCREKKDLIELTR